MSSFFSFVLVPGTKNEAPKTPGTKNARHQSNLTHHAAPFNDMEAVTPDRLDDRWQ